MTWGVWAKPDVPSSIRAVLSADDGSFDRGIDIDARGGGGDTWSSFTGSGVVSSGVTPSTSTWTFLAAVYDQSLATMTFYVNDQAVTVATSFGTSHTFFDIGHNPDFGEFFIGALDNVFVYNQTLTPTEIAAIRTNGFPTSPVPEIDPGSAAGVAAFVAGFFSLHRRHRRIR